jgi:hypothetical protein
MLTIHPHFFFLSRSDFENGIKAAALSLRAYGLFSPDLQMGFCYFHFCQAIYRKMRELGHFQAYQLAALGVRLAVRRVMGLAFLPVDRVVFTFTAIQREFNLIAPNLVINGVTRPDLTQFFLYVRHNYIHPGTVAEIPMWNKFDNLHHRTNNNLEGYHNQLKNKVGQMHPGLWKMIVHMQLEEKETRITLSRLDNGIAVCEPRRLSYFRLELRILQLKIDYNLNVYSDLQYVTLCSTNLNAQLFP